jgi:hypothetical protein
MTAWRDEIERFQQRRRSVLLWLGVPAVLGIAICCCSVTFHLRVNPWVVYISFGVSFVTSALIPLLVRCPFCSKQALSSDSPGFGFNPQQCPHCGTGLRM